jgi:adenylate kinase
VRGERGFILDGYPRTKAQAEKLSDITDIQLAVNLSLREDILISKCLGRRMCNECGRNYNVANIQFPAVDGKPAVVMPPLMPPDKCMQKMETRADDTEEVVRRRLQVCSGGGSRGSGGRGGSRDRFCSTHQMMDSSHVSVASK